MKVSGAVPVLVKVTVCDADAEPIAVDGKVRLVGETVAAIVTGAAPVPLRETVCGEFVALLAKLTAATRVPVAAGLKVTVTVHKAFAASVAAQLLVSENDEALVPVMPMPEMVIAPVPELVRLTACVAEDVPIVVGAKTRLVDDRLATGVFAANPVPLNATVCGEFGALSARLTEAASAPVVAGLKVTVTVQEAFTASVAAQLLVSENEEA